MSTEQPGSDGVAPAVGEQFTAEPRQRVVRVRGARRAQLTPAPGTDPSPEDHVPDADDDARPKLPGSPADDRITRERPPHW